MRSVFSRFNAASVARVMASGEKSCGISRWPRPRGLAMRHEIVADLGRDHDLVALVGESFREQLFAQAVAVGVGSIEKRDAEIERLVHERDGLAFREIVPTSRWRRSRGRIRLR